MNRTIEITENKLNETIQKHIKENRDVNRVFLKLREGYVVLCVELSFLTNPVICQELIPEKIWMDSEAYSLQMKRPREIYIESEDGKCGNGGLSGDQLESFVTEKLNETGFFQVDGTRILMKVEKDSKWGAYGDLAPDLVKKAIETSKLVCRYEVLMIETEVSDWDIKAAILKNPGAIGKIFSNRARDKGSF